MRKCLLCNILSSKSLNSRKWSWQPGLILMKREHIASKQGLARGKINSIRKNPHEC